MPDKDIIDEFAELKSGSVIDDIITDSAGSGMLDSIPTEPMNTRVTPIFFIIDNSTSMEGTKMQTVNTAMEEIMRDLVNFNNSDSEIMFAVLKFGLECEWETGEGGLVPCSGVWNEIKTADAGFTCFNTACHELKEKLSGSHGFFNFAGKRTITPPILILMTDGYANDGDREGKDGIAELSGNKYYMGSYKIAIPIGSEANHRLCENFTGDKELVHPVYNAVALKKILEIAVKNSVVVSSAGKSDVQRNNAPNPVIQDTGALKSLLKDEFDNNKLEEINVPISSDDWD